MVKYTQTIRRQFADELLSVFDHFVRLALKAWKLMKQDISCFINFNPLSAKSN